MEVQFGNNSVDEPNLLYKLQRRIKVFNTTNNLPNRGYNLVASSSKYGLVFVAVPDGTLSVYYLNNLVDKESNPQHLSVRLPEKPTHIAVSCDYELLAVTGGQLLSFYKVTDFQNPNVSPALTIKSEANPSTFVSALQWNPCIPDSIAIAFYDGTLLACTVGNGQVKRVPSKARCICWSPKGKQLVTGNSDGSLSQYKPDLTQAKAIPPPKLFEGSPVEALAVYWISTFQFAVVYKNAADNSRPAVTIVNTPKAIQPSCLNYEDICYSMGSNRPWYYYLQGIPQWNIILTSSSNSMEIATIGSVDGSNWTQWCQSDEARPELPMTKKQENYPVGISVDVCAIHQLPWGENETLPHMPLLHVISQTGELTIFNVINLSKQAAQVCSPPQQLALPAAALTNVIPGEAPAPTPAPAPAPAPAPVAAPAPAPIVEIKPQPIPAPQPQPAPPAVSQIPSAGIKIPSFQPSQQFAKAPPVTLPPEPKPVDIKPTPQIPQPIAPPPKPQPAQPTPMPPQETAAMKAEKEKIAKAKANLELKNVLIKEVNDFQTELYNFMVKTRETQAKIQRDIESINSNFNFDSLDTEQLKKDCSIEDLRGAVVQLKLELVRACAVVAEAKTHSEAKDIHEWTQADPLTTQRVASVKKLAYYVQSQLEQAHKALDYKWNQLASKDPQYNKTGSKMIRPILDEVYQPLVKQQEILSRQQAVLRTLRKAFNECDVGPVFKSTSLLKNSSLKKDPLSKLTKNILNMSIEPKTTKKNSLYSAHKLDTLRDALSNHKTTRIKPVNIELRQHLATLRQNYEKSLKEKVSVKTEPEVKPVIKVPQPVPIKIEPKPEPIRQNISAPAFTSNVKPVQPGLANVARTLFTDDPKPEVPKPQIPFQAQPLPKSSQPSIFAPAPASTSPVKSVIKDLLQNKSQLNLSAKNDSNTFMGQKICSPTAFGQTSTASPTPASNMFTAKPISDINNMFSKFQPQAFAADLKPNLKSSETGEAEATSKPGAFDFKTKDKPITNLFGMKTQTAQNVPDVLKTMLSDKTDKAKGDAEKSKENVPEKLSENAAPVKIAEKKEPVKPLGVQTLFKNETVIQAKPESNKILDEHSELKIEKAVEKPKLIEKPESPSLTITPLPSNTSAAPKPATIQKSEPVESPKTSVSEKPTDLTTVSSASSIFGAAVASQPKTQTSSIFSSPSAFTSTTQAPVLGTSSQSESGVKSPSLSSEPVKSPSFSGGSVFTATTDSSVFGQTTPSPTSTAASVFASAVTTSPTNTVSEATSTAPSIFSTATSLATPSPTSTAPAFTSTTSVFGSSVSIFSATTTTPTTTSTSVFGITTAAAPSVFGTSSPTQSAFAPTTAAVFVPPTTTETIYITPNDPASVFAQAGKSVFGTATTQSSIFGTATTQASVFGSNTNQGSVFGSTTTTPAFGATQSPSVFGQTTQASVFGATPTASVFGTPTQSSQASVFGSPTQTTQASVFGSPTPTTQASVFGTTPTQGSVFGTPTTTQSGSLFGGGEANMFASASISTTSASSPGSGGSIFGGGSNGSVFGSAGTNVFGGKSTFGQSNATAASIFGGASGGANATATNFWAGANNNSGFGSSGFGQQPTTQASSIFGGTTGGSFSAPSAGAFGSPQPNAFGTPEAKPSVFGSPQQQTAPGGFGGSPVFGNKPVFGQSPTSGGGFGGFGGFNKSPSSGFGAPASFGGSGFGGFGNTSPGKMFGNAPPSFGSPTQSNATFENLANQNTLTFGNLAQQSGQQPAPAAPAFNTSPSFTGWRG